MRKVASHLLLFVFTFVFGAFLFAKPAEAGFVDWFKNITVTKQVTENVINSGEMVSPDSTKSTLELLSHAMVGIQFFNFGGDAVAMLPDSNFYGYSKDQLRNEIGGGLFGDVSQGIVAMYNPPASSQTYVADLLESAKIVPEAQAQGLGFASLDPVLETWKTFRNIAYLFFVVIFLVIGFMIMFRSKVGQAAITVQQAIPSILIALLAVTFSYAIAGFLIDLMYLVMYMIAGLFGDAGGGLVEMNFFQIVGKMMNGTWGSAHDGIKDLMTNLLDAGWVGEAIGWISGLTGSVIVGIAILLGTFKIFFELLKSYVSLILQVVFAPIVLMTDAIPGQNKFISWVKNIVGNLAMWPIVLVCILVQKMLTQGSSTDTASGFMPPFLLGQGQGAIFPVLVGVGILLVVPEIMQQAKKALGVDEGIFGGLAKSALDQLKQGVPLGGRISGATLGAGAGAALGAAASLPKAITASKGKLGADRFRTIMNTVGDAALEGQRYSIGKFDIDVGGAKAGATAGTTNAVRFSNSIGAGQPDIINLATNAIDKVANVPEDVKRRTRLGQEAEDVLQRIGNEIGASAPASRQGGIIRWEDRTKK